MQECQIFQLRFGSDIRLVLDLVAIAAHVTDEIGRCRLSGTNYKYIGKFTVLKGD
jgi:hypothetical protein